MKLALLILIPCMVQAQEMQKITGRVIDAASQVPVSNVIVTIEDSAGPQQVLTDEAGSFTFLDVLPWPLQSLYSARGSRSTDR